MFRNFGLVRLVVVGERTTDSEYLVRKMSKVLRTVFKIGNTSENIPSTIYYFSHPVTSEGNIQVPPGFWSFYPDPSVDAATRLNRHEAHHTVRLSVKRRSFVRISKLTSTNRHKFTYYGSLGASHLALLRGIDSYGCLPAHDVVFEDQPRSKVQKATAGPRSMLSRARRLLK
ncbi:hypothetical protein SISSUDRAFT_532248 [Sistotremastrum suecicum HHB10207 ss-3]|uniref:Uncharacterized protein n=1 Tax=Sistotremastrum suecicum HHB10207 ss-3 TaxID=1314776 RepID=A0A166F4I7_9AGAM|nr:hypothetical protein SISSUDRAFT_532248 [Sistotremastrum suecicum HHB10207 ss-3]